MNSSHPGRRKNPKFCGTLCGCCDKGKPKRYFPAGLGRRFCVFSYFVLLWSGLSGLAAQPVQFSRAQLAAPPARLDTSRLFSDEPVHSPWGALLRSAVLPGWGQVYNRQYWKAAGVVAVHAVLLERAMHFNRLYKERNDRTLRRTRNTFYWLLGAAYVLNLLDAFVEAYLFGFDQVMDTSAVAARERKPGTIHLEVQIPLFRPAPGP